MTMLITIAAFLVVGGIVWVAGLYVNNGETETEE